MSLHSKLQQRAAAGRPVRVGLIGAGKFGSMYLAQVPRTPGIHLVGIVDLSPAAARANLARVGWEPERTRAASLDDAARSGATHLGEDWRALVSHPAIDVIVESTGNPIAAVEHCLGAFAQRKHLVNVTVEADAFCGPLLARGAAEAGVLYSLAFGDQPALICELVDWARTCGFPVAAAGRGHKWQPHYSESTPDTVWDHWGLTVEQALRGEATGAATCWNADVVATAKRDLQAGETLDGEGGFTVWGKLLPASRSLEIGGLPLGLAHDVRLLRPVKKGRCVCWADVAIDTTTQAYRTRRSMESMFAPAARRAA